MIPVNQSASKYLERLVSEYLWTHPLFKFPPNGNKHPAVLALTTEMQPWVIDRLGGIDDYFRAMIAAAREWFPVGSRPMEFRYFCQSFEIAGCLGADQSAWYQEICKDYSAWRQEKKDLEAAAQPVDGMAAKLTVVLPRSRERTSLYVPPQQWRDLRLGRWLEILSDTYLWSFVAGVDGNVGILKIGDRGQGHHVEFDDVIVEQRFPSSTVKV